MARFYADENVPFPVVKFLRGFGHDVLTVKEAGKANLAISDLDVLIFATNQSRTVLTGNKRDYINLHRLNSEHSGIVVYSEDVNFERLANRIHQAVKGEKDLTRKLIRVNRPQQ